MDVIDLVVPVRVRAYVGESRPRVRHASLRGVSEEAVEELVVRVIEVVIDPRVELIPIGVHSVSVRLVQTIDAARKPDAGGVQTVANGVIVWERHSREPDVLDKTARVVCRPECIAGAAVGKREHVEGLEITRRP